MVLCGVKRNEGKVEQNESKNSCCIALNKETIAVVFAVVCAIGALICHFTHVGSIATYACAGGAGLTALIAAALRYCSYSPKKAKEEGTATPQQTTPTTEPETSTRKKTGIEENKYSQNFGTIEKKFVSDFEEAASIRGVIVDTFNPALTQLDKMTDQERAHIIGYLNCTTGGPNTKKERVGLAQATANYIWNNHPTGIDNNIIAAINSL